MLRLANCPPISTAKFVAYAADASHSHIVLWRHMSCVWEGTAIFCNIVLGIERTLPPEAFLQAGNLVVIMSPD